MKLVGLSRSVSMGETRGATGEQPRNISIICSGLNSTDTNKGRTTILENPQARFIGPPTDCGGVIQQTWGSILNIAILLMAKIWTSFGWWFIYIYLTIYRVLLHSRCCIWAINENISVACATNAIQHLTVFVRSGRDDIIWTRKPWCDYSTWHPTVKQPFHDQLKQVLVEPVMSIIYTYVQTKICVQIYHCTYTKIIFTLIINHVSKLTLCAYIRCKSKMDVSKNCSTPKSSHV